MTYWESGTHWVYNYLTHAVRPCTRLVLAILDSADHWMSGASIREGLSGEDDGIVDRTIDEMIRDKLLDSADHPWQPADRALSAWEGWNPAAGFFHAATKTVATLGPEDLGYRRSRILVEHDFPPVLKKYEGRPRFELPACTGTGQLADVLHRRRTWREFGDRNLTLNEAATLLGLTFGVQRWLEVDDDRWVALKTSPGGGARHSIEAYLFSFGIDGLENGTYHYDPDSHALNMLGSPTSRDLLTAFIPTQACFRDPAAFIVMTSIFARMRWKYPHPHAYRVVLLDAGHLSQTFALVATALGLAPFCTAAVDSTAIEKHLGIDGISEAVVHTVGVGPRPPNKDWAPMHDHSAPPRTAQPAWANRLPAPPFP